MGQSTNGQLCYGIILEEGYEFPWGEGDGDEVQWWLYDVCGYKNPFEIFDEDGNYIGGLKPNRKKIEEYFERQREAEEKNPMPFVLVNYCSGDVPMYILAIPSTKKSASRGFPKEVTSLDLDEKDKERFLDVCKKHFGVEEDPQWYLSSYWG